MDADWQRIIAEVLEQEVQRSGGAVPGAKLRTLVARKAQDLGLGFPPPEMRTFSSFVEGFSSSFIVQRRPGQDVLVAPATEPEALTKKPEQTESSGAARLRQDLFNALTRIPTNGGPRPYYEPSTDAVQWEESLIDSKWIALPSSSLEEEIGVRRRFATEQSEEIAQDLAACLTSSTPLREFTAKLHEHRLVLDWHQFRLKDLVLRLKEWASQHGLEWGSTWVETTEPRPSNFDRSPVPAHINFRDLQRLVSYLSERDLARIQVPLDIVLKLVGKA